MLFYIIWLLYSVSRYNISCSYFCGQITLQMFANVSPLIKGYKKIAI